MATSSCDRGRGKNKQYWTDEEADTLVDVLQEFACDPLWKVGGGFRNNYMVEVRKRIVQKIPSFDKDANPHIDSRIRYLKNKYNPISEMLMQSGCQWDDVENKINCEKQWYDDWCKNHKNASGLWNFKFPYLHKLDEVWGRDRATGLKAEDMSQACENTSNNNKNNVVVCSSSDSEDEVVTSSNTLPGNNHNSKRRKKLSPRRESFHKQRKSVTPQQTVDARLDSFASEIKSVCGEMVSQIGVVASALMIDTEKSESLSGEKMQEVMNELLNIGISDFEVRKVVEACYNDPTKIKTFFTLPGYMRRAYVLGFLHPQN